jgi:diguanylate cyclase (GGDEF)-like protein
MPDSPLPNVLILSGDGGAGRRWAEALVKTTAGVWFSEADLPPDVSVDVVLTDLAADEVARRTNLKIDPQAANVSPPGLAVVAIGSAPWADVALPADCTGRELSVACRLVAQIARLRSKNDELDRIREEATQLAQTDPLTGLPNRRAWEHQFQTRVARGARGEGRLWLAIVDLDNFKPVNDRLGMSQGDQVLVRAAQALAGQLRRHDVVARLGGDEFGVLLSNVSESHVLGVFDRLRSAVAEQAAPDGLALVTASIGYVAGDESGDAGALFAAAERAMRDAKRGGGNRALRGDSFSPGAKP